MTATTFPADLELGPVSRWPTTLPEASMCTVLKTPIEQRVRRIGARHVEPLVSIVVIACDGLVFTRLCLESLLATRSSVDFEVVVIDNGSTDGTDRYLMALAALDARVSVQRTRRTVGFAAATNAGLARSRGSIVVFLNNDTIVSAGVLERVAAHLADPSVGLLGAVTNRAGNEAEIETSYRTYGELLRFARRHMRTAAHEPFQIRTATMFCAAIRRDVYSSIGPLDEQFEVGLFEDDDYSMRVRQLGYRVVCAEDVFVHHFGQASIGRLAATGEYGRVFHANRARWEAKWGMAWVPYQRREKRAYRALVTRVRSVVRDVVPQGATVAVISKGDEELLELDGRTAWHFPQDPDGVYAGHYPADSDACIAELERMRQNGADYLVIPATAQWWVRHYREFGEYLTARYRALGDEGSATVFMLTRS